MIETRHEVAITDLTADPGFSIDLQQPDSGQTIGTVDGFLSCVRNDEVDLGNIFVAEQYQRQGYGTELMARWLLHSRQRGFEAALVDTTRHAVVRTLGKVVGAHSDALDIVYAEQVELPDATLEACAEHLKSIEAYAQLLPVEQRMLFEMPVISVRIDLKNTALIAAANAVITGQR